MVCLSFSCLPAGTALAVWADLDADSTDMDRVFHHMVLLDKNLPVAEELLVALLRVEDLLAARWPYLEGNVTEGFSWAS